MPATQFGKVIQHIHAMAAGRRVQELTDRQLLDKFLASREHEVFAALVSRHGQMVFRVCWHVLHQEQDAEDAFQAVFLVLARNGNSIRKPEALAEWLHGVAYRTAMKVKRSAARRRKHETALESEAPAKSNSPSWDDVQLVLDEEIQQLPKAYKAAFVLCVLQGKTCSQAARELDIPVGTVTSRLTWARKRLQQRLARRGIELSALLVALSVAEGVGRTMPAHLTNAKLISSLLGAATGAGTVSIAPHIVSLAAAVGRAMFLSKAKLTTLLLLAFSVVAASGALACQALGERPTQTPTASSMPAQSNNKDKHPTSKDNDSTTSVTYSGRVVDADDKPVPRAKVYYHFSSSDYEPHPVRAQTDAQGKFVFTLNRSDVPESADRNDIDPLKMGHVIVKADGFTYAWRTFVGRPIDGGKPELDPVYQLARDDTPVEGKILDLEGKPLPNLRISVLSATASSDLDDFIEAIGKQKSVYESMLPHFSKYLVNMNIKSTMARFLPGATTDKDGRFVLHGFAKEQLLELRIEGEPIETQTMFAMTRYKPAGLPAVFTPVRMKEEWLSDNEKVFVLWNGFTHTLPRGRVVVGTVRDDSTGQPIPRAIVESYQLAGSTLGENTIYHTVADENGRYRFSGLPRGKGNRIRIRPPADLPYLPTVKEVPVASALAEAVVDIGLERGVWVDVTTKDKSTGKPVSGEVSYYLLPEDWDTNPVMAPPNNRYSFAFNHFMRIRPNGSFRFVGARGRAIVAFRADSKNYPVPAEAYTIKLPSHLAPINYSAFSTIAPKADDQTVNAEFVLESGRSFHGWLVDPDGQKLTGVVATDLRGDHEGPVWPALRTADFTVVGLEPGRPRLICFIHLAKKLAGSLVVRGDSDTAKVVRMTPWATVSGRLLDAQGSPIKNSNLEFSEKPRRRLRQPAPLDLGIYVREPNSYSRPPKDWLHTDEDGRFFAERLIPGLKYTLALLGRNGSETGFAFSNLIFKPGESKNLGDVTLQLPPEK